MEDHPAVSAAHPEGDPELGGTAPPAVDERRLLPAVALDAGISALVGGVLIRLGADTIADPDLWGHVRFGQLATRIGGVSLVDPYSYLTTGHTWINHEWLTEVIFGRLWDHFHTPGLVALKSMMVLLVLGLVFVHLWRSGLGTVRGALLTLLFGVPTLLGLGTIRPQMFTYLFFVVTLLLIEAAEEGELRWLWLVPVVFAAWVNLHGGVLAGVAVLGLWIATTVLSWGRDRWKHRGSDGEPEGPGGGPGRRGLLFIMAIGVAALAALLVNPYGLRLPLFLLHTATGARPDISEWRHLAIESRLGGVWLAYVLFAGWTLWRSPRRPRPAILALLFVLTLLPLSATRHLPLYALAVPILLARDLGALRARRDARAEARGRRETGRGRALALGLVAGLVGVFAVVQSLPDFRCIPLAPDRGIPYPARAVGLLERSGVGGDLAVYFDWGEYALWHLSPRLRVGMDGRRETVYPDSVYDAYLHWQNGTDDWDRFTRMGSPDLALVSRKRPVFNLLSLDPKWVEAYGDSLAGLFGRVGSRALEQVRSTPPPDLPVDGEGLCFP
ncbi:MAG: hypothetical protein Q8W51_05860 [Candidatus Palauibacterales bacterium]|nr:hypothetical protein [Candidatus Palauibacterales bacterium]